MMVQDLDDGWGLVARRDLSNNDLLVDRRIYRFNGTNQTYIYIEVKDLIWTGCGVVIDET